MLAKIFAKSGMKSFCGLHNSTLYQYRSGLLLYLHADKIFVVAHLGLFWAKIRLPPVIFPFCEGCSIKFCFHGGINSSVRSRSGRGVEKGFSDFVYFYLLLLVVSEKIYFRLLEKQFFTTMKFLSLLWDIYKDTYLEASSFCQNKVLETKLCWDGNKIL